MINSISAELLKMRKSSIVWLLWLTGLGLSLSIAVIYVWGPESFVTMGKNPWTKYTNFSLSLFSMIVFPFFVLLLTSSNILLEHRSNSWKSIFTLSNS
ncbi:MAG: ABC transporter permease, partial [Bacteroidota bacterium]